MKGRKKKGRKGRKEGIFAYLGKEGRKKARWERGKDGRERKEGRNKKTGGRKGGGRRKELSTILVEGSIIGILKEGREDWGHLEEEKKKRKNE